MREALATPETEALRVAASSIDHPYLRPIVLDLSDGITPDEAAIVAVLANPGLRAARARRGVAAAQLFAAGVLPNPQLSATADVPLKDTTGASTAVGLGLSLDLNALFTRGTERQAARAEQDQVRLDVAWQEWQVAQSARRQAYGVAFLTREVTLARDQETALRENLAVLTEASRRGLSTDVERSAAETAYLAARTTRLDLELQRDTTRLGVLRLLGFPADAKLRLQAAALPFGADTSEYDTTAVFPSLPPADSLSAYLERRRLDLTALRFGYESQDASLRAAILRQFPTLNIGLNRLRSDSRLLSLGPALSIGIPFFDHNQGEIAVARATRSQLRKEYAARVFEARSDVSFLYKQITGFQKQVRTAVATVRAQRALVETYGRALRLGDADVLTYYRARIDLISAEVAEVQLRRTLAALSVALETTTGGLFSLPTTQNSP